MRNISFMLTTDQVLNETKSVTRRTGWEHLKPGQRLQGVEKGMGLKKGEKIRKLKVIEVIDVRREPLMAMTDDEAYGRRECVLEGFGEHPTLRDPQAFVDFYIASHRGSAPGTLVTRIQFKYVQD